MKRQALIEKLNEALQICLSIMEDDESIDWDLAQDCKSAIWQAQTQAEKMEEL